jgi:hypothetical protein
MAKTHKRISQKTSKRMRKRRMSWRRSSTLRKYRANSDGLAETNYLLRSPANAKELLAAIADADAGKFEEHELLNE